MTNRHPADHASAIEAILGCRFDEKERQLVNGHDYSDPLARTRVRLDSEMRVLAKMGRNEDGGNSIYIAGTCVVMDGKTIHIGVDGIATTEQITYEEWKDGFEANGWTVTKGFPSKQGACIDPEYAREARESKRVHLQFVKNAHHDHILVHLPIRRIGGEWESKGIIVTSSGDTRTLVGKLLERVEAYEARLPNTGKTMKRYVGGIIKREFNALARRIGLPSDFQCEIAGVNETFVHLNMTLLDERMKDTRKYHTIDYEHRHFEDEIIKVDPTDMERLEKVLKKQVRRLKKQDQKRTVTRIASNMNALIGRGRNLRKHRHGSIKKLMKGGVTTEIRKSVKDGVFDCEVHIIRSAGNIHIKKGQCLLVNMNVPEAVKNQAAGRHVSDIVDHPFLAGDIIVTSVKSVKEGTLVRYRQGASYVEDNDTIGEPVARK